MNWERQATSATRKAAMLRARLGLGAADAACPVDALFRLKVDVWFRAEPSLEGLYLPGTPPRVVINSLRPAGRRRYTAGHELGHHVHGHGASLDSQLQNQRGSDEFLANRFSRAFLMPKLAVANAYARRGWSARTTTALQAFVVAQDLGVGYTTLLDHMAKTLRLTEHGVAATLSKTPLRRLRAELVGEKVEHDAVSVDEHWGARPVDIEVGDVIVVPPGTQCAGACLLADMLALRATRAGTTSLIVPGRTEAVPVRVAKRGYVGRAIYRHLEDSDDD